jgi:tetratricopeptide (TPR) repeat protein
MTMSDVNVVDNAELLALQRIDDACAHLQRQGSYLEALECMERGLVLRQHFFGSDSSEVWRAAETVGEMCNLLAMTYLQQEDFPLTLELLKKAEILTERDMPGKAVTYNNMACYYRRQGKLRSALQYLERALKIEAKLGSRVECPADTHLNACAVLSQLGRHQSALEHAQAALILLQEELFERSSTEPPRADRVAVLAIAYHNMGVEQEFLKKFESSLQSYRKGVECAQKWLGPSHAVTITLRNSTVAARRAIAVRDRQIRSQLNDKNRGRVRQKPREEGVGLSSERKPPTMLKMIGELNMVSSRPPSDSKEGETAGSDIGLGVGQMAEETPQVASGDSMLTGSLHSDDA